MTDRAGAAAGGFWADVAGERALDRYATLVNMVDDGIYQLDDEGRFVAVNDAIVELTGYARAELLGEHASLVVADEDAGRIEREIERRLAADDRGADPIEFTARTADGEAIPCELELHLLVEDGALQGTIGVAREISERKRTRQQLREERDMFAEGPAIVFRWEPDAAAGWPVEYVSENVEDVLGYAPAELESGEVAYADLLFDEEMDRIAEEVAEHADGETERFSHDPYRVKTSDGGVKWVKDTTKIVRDEDGEVTSYLGYLVDITERKERERELQRYETIVETVNDGIYAKDRDGRFTMVNEAYAELTGYDREELLGEHASLVVDEGAIQQSREALGAMADDDTDTPTVEAQIRTADGERVPTEGTFATLETDDGEPEEVGVVRDITERKAHERELKRTERRYRTLAEHFPNGIVTLFDHDLRYELAAGQSFDEIPADPDDVEGHHFSEVWDERIVDAIRPALRAALDGREESVELEYDGRDWVMHSVPITDERGDVFAGMTMAQDITERKERERRLAESERRYRTLVENFPNGAVGLFDRNLRYKIAGGDGLDDVGVSAEEIVGKTLWERYPESLAERLEPKFRAALDGETNSFEMEFHGRHWLAYTVPVRDDEGEIFAGMIMVQDITERKERERELRESKNQLRALIDVLPVAVFVAEADGEIVEWNEAAEAVWGGEIAESESVADYEEYEAWWADSGDPVEPDEWPLARALRGEEVTDPDEIRIKGFDGEYRTVLNQGMPVLDADGEVSRAVVTLVDITERKEYQRKLEESNERLKQFAYAASHDLQEPLRMVSSYLQLIEQRYAEELDEDAREFLQYAVDGADRMREMVDGLLSYSRVETRNEPLEPTDLDAVFDDALTDLQVRIEESGAEITRESLPTVEGDANQLRQVFQNLLSNAIEYSGDEPPRVHVSAERDGPRWVVAVRDDGIGIDPDDQDRIFEVFQRLHTRDEHAGTGIGLALCERIVDRHGGDIWVDSEPGEGATVSFTLPATEDRDAR